MLPTKLKSTLMAIAMLTVSGVGCTNVPTARSTGTPPSDLQVLAARTKVSDADVATLIGSLSDRRVATLFVALSHAGLESAPLASASERRRRRNALVFADLRALKTAIREAGVSDSHVEKVVRTLEELREEINLDQAVASLVVGLESEQARAHMVSARGKDYGAREPTVE